MATERSDAESAQRHIPAERLTYSVIEAGALAGLGKNAAYEAARRGEMPTIRLGGRILVPKKRWDAILNGEVAA